jgi:uncharacterized membrane protein YfcA
VVGVLALAALFGVVIGFVAALFGVGGGVVALPLMILVLGVKPTVAVGTNSVLIIFTTSFSAFFHWRQGTLRKEGLYLGLGGALGSLLGNALFFQIAPYASLVRKVLGAFFVMLGALMLVPQRGGERESISPARLFAVGLAVGTFAGLTGMSGGILTNSLLAGVLKLNVKAVIGMSVMANVVITIVSAIPKVLKGYADVPLALSMVPGVIVGTRLGAKVMKGLKAKSLRKLFALFLIAVGLKFLA